VNAKIMKKSAFLRFYITPLPIIEVQQVSSAKLLPAALREAQGTGI